MTMPTGSDPSGYQIEGVDGTVLGAGLSALVGRTQASVTAAKKAEIGGNANIGTIMETLYEGIETELGIIFGPLQALILKLFPWLDLSGVTNTSDLLALVEAIPIIGDIVKAIVGIPGDLADLATWASGVVSGLSTAIANAATALGNFISIFASFAVPDLTGWIGDLLGTKSTANTAGTNASTAIANWAAWLSGGSWGSVGAAVGDFLATKLAASSAASAAATAGTNATTALGNWTTWLSGGSWANIGAAVTDFLSTKSTASSAASAASTAGTNATTALGNFATLLTNAGESTIAALGSGYASAKSNASSAATNWTSWLSGGSWANITASVTDFLGTKSKASTADTNASTAIANATAAKADADAAAATAQGATDASINALRNTPGVTGQSADDLEDTFADWMTSFFNRLGGNNVARASQDQVDSVLTTLASTVNSQSAAISALQHLLNGANGFSASIPFRAAETTPFPTPGSFTYVLPSWFVLGTDSVDGLPLGAGGGASGQGIGAGPGSNGGDSTLVVNGTTHTGVGGVGSGSGTRVGLGPGPTTYLDILYPGGSNQGMSAGDGNVPGGGGAGATDFTATIPGGLAGTCTPFSVVPTSATITGTVGAPGAGGVGFFGGLSGGDGARGVVNVRARAAMPSSFTSMGTLILPSFKLNTGVALTDSMTVAATWSRVPPNGASGGHILITRANTGCTNYVYLRVWYVSGTTNYEIGKVTSGVKTAWKTGTIGDAIPFNAFSLSADNARTFTVAINGSGFDSYNDSTGTSSMGAAFRSGGWGSSDSALPGSITQFAFLDSGTPSRITSASVATAQGTTSTTYTDLATTGPSVTVNVPASGEVVVQVSATLTTGGTTQMGSMGFVLSGANTLAASDANAAALRGATGVVNGRITSGMCHLTGLTPGTTTFKAVYKASGNTQTFTDRNIIVDPKP